LSVINEEVKRIKSSHEYYKCQKIYYLSDEVLNNRDLYLKVCKEAGFAVDEWFDINTLKFSKKLEKRPTTLLSSITEKTLTINFYK